MGPGRPAPDRVQGYHRPVTWPQVRAGLIALAIVVGMLDGCPVPRGRREHQRMVSRIGPELSEVVDGIDRARRFALEPARPVLELARLHQRWKLFAGAPAHAFRMWIEARSQPGGPWLPLYVANDDRHDFAGDQLGYRRVRGVWNPHSSEGPRAGYPAFVDWIAGQVFARRPEAVEVRVSMERVVIGDRGGGRPTGERFHVQTRLRPAAGRR